MAPGVQTALKRTRTWGLAARVFIQPGRGPPGFWPREAASRAGRGLALSPERGPLLRFPARGCPPGPVGCAGPFVTLCPFLGLLLDLIASLCHGLENRSEPHPAGG